MGMAEQQKCGYTYMNSLNHRQTARVLTGKIFLSLVCTKYYYVIQLNLCHFILFDSKGHLICGSNKAVTIFLAIYIVQSHNPAFRLPFSNPPGNNFLYSMMADIIYLPYKSNDYVFHQCMKCVHHCAGKRPPPTEECQAGKLAGGGRIRILHPHVQIPPHYPLDHRRLRRGFGLESSVYSVTRKPAPSTVSISLGPPHSVCNPTHILEQFSELLR